MRREALLLEEVADAAERSLQYSAAADTGWLWCA
jgi:hypothetical protein